MTSHVGAGLEGRLRRWVCETDVGLRIGLLQCSWKCTKATVTTRMSGPI